MKAVRKDMMEQAVALPSFEEAMPLMIAFAPNWPARKVLFRIFGTAMILGSALMWLLPGADMSAEAATFKLGASLFFLLCGMALLMMHHVDNQPDAYFDPIRREVRVLQKNNRGRPQTVLRRSYESLGAARFTENLLEVFDVDGTMLMRLPIESPEVRDALRAQLSGMVNITA
ncbi:hypothetical protein Q5Y75_01690 [Ruegeria sp. 2205SS24-7]|uniref:hypothetical protein n=1 Tax=Ruegeria discodermiae TaxID=3064389 RepID=UPI0027403EE2|nr:hypothetical protein [Ruegeria sp. 2205SS24-7]MDP5215920.1 hypothetical protein [Ruegeria sp. 2205SS24-7]